jgi:hypothetical protein
MDWLVYCIQILVRLIEIDALNAVIDEMCGVQNCSKKKYRYCGVHKD